eukprot:XP_017948706.1 PREDICTED: interleukin-2 receptor subunit beta [Xenopus tropicalis]
MEKGECKQENAGSKRMDETGVQINGTDVNIRMRPETLTVGSKMDTTVSCYTEGAGNKSVQSIDYFPYENLRLDPPMSLKIMEHKEGKWSLSWRCHHSSYITTFREYEVNYKSSSQMVALTIPVRQDELSAPLQDLAPDTIYEAKVRVRYKFNGVWSEWSQPYRWKTHSRETTGSSSPILEVVIGIIVLVILCFIITIIYKQDRVKKILWVGVPDPSRFFDPLMSKYGGNFQKWISSPFSLSSFSMDDLPLDISPVDFKCKQEEPSIPILPTSPQETNTDCSENSFSSFNNKEYFFFQYPAINEGGSSNSYFTYDNLEQRGFPAMLQGIPFPSPTGLDETPLFQGDSLSLPLSTGLSFHNRSFEEDILPSVLQTFPQQGVREEKQNLEPHESLSNQVTEIPKDKQVMNVCEDKKESFDGGNICSEINPHSATNSQNKDAAAGYLSLKEIYNRWA